MRNDRVMPVLGGVGTHFLLARLCGYIGLITSNYRDGDGDGDEIRLDLLQLSNNAENPACATETNGRKKEYILSV